MKRRVSLSIVWPERETSILGSCNIRTSGRILTQTEAGNEGLGAKALEDFRLDIRLAVA